MSGTPGKGDAPAELKIAVTATDDGDPNESATTTFALKVSPGVAACETAVTVGEAPVALTGEPWNAPDCMAHHRTDSPARYFKVALAEETALELEEIVVQVNRDMGVTFLLVEHDMQMVMKVCDHIYVINFGANLADGTPAEVQANADVIAAYLGEVTS